MAIAPHHFVTLTIVLTLSSVCLDFDLVLSDMARPNVSPIANLMVVSALCASLHTIYAAYLIIGIASKAELKHGALSQRRKHNSNPSCAWSLL